MAGRGFVAEGWAYSQSGNAGPRYNDTLFRGQATITTGSLVITLPLPIRFAGFAQATIVASSAPSAGSIVTVGTFNKNTFTIYVWQATSSSVTTLIASTTATTVNWVAWGAVTDNFVSGAY